MFQLISVFLALSSALEYSTTAAAGDEITNLPGLGYEIKFKQYSGYVTLPNARQIFYWYVESENNPSTDPLLLWTNGGPGCSGLSGFMTEMGPFRPNKDGTLAPNPYAWNKLANMVFIEQPAGVGFSTVNGHIVYGDQQAAEDNYAFIKGFYAKFPELSRNALYLTSESYGGHYLPTLAQEIVKQGDLPSFKGFAVGNPLTWMPYRDYGQWGTYNGHQLLPAPLWDQYEVNDCKVNEDSDTCNQIINEINIITQGLDPYALDFPVCTSELAAGRMERFAFKNNVHRSLKNRRGLNLQGYFPDEYEPCSSDYGAAYLNRADVQKAIHAGQGLKWEECNMLVNMGWNETDLDASMQPIYEFLITQGLRLMIFSGDNDSICATLGTQQFIWDFEMVTGQEWASWNLDGQVAGYTQGFKGLRFTTVHGAGHMVPSTRPAQALELLRKFLDNEW